MLYNAFGTVLGGGTAFGTSIDGDTVFGFPVGRNDTGMELAIMTMLADICRAYPATFDGSGTEAKCLRPQSFAVLEKLSDLDADNLNKSSPKYASASYFFSHRFEDAGRDPAQMGFDYPLFAMAYNPMQFALKARRSEHRYRYSIGVFDQNEPDKKEYLSYCSNRTMEQQSHDLKQMLLNVLAELKNWAYCYATATRQQGLFPTSAIPPGFTIVHEAIDLVANETMEAEYIRNAYSDKLSAVFASIEFIVPRCEPSVSFHYVATENLYNPTCESC